MIWLLLTIFCATSIFVSFKLASKYKASVIVIVVVNYLVASLLGYFLTGGFSLSEVVKYDWFPISLIIGVMFVLTFLLIGESSDKVGMSITTVASKMSVIIPMLFSIVFYSEQIGLLKILGISTALFAVIITVYRKGSDNKKVGWLILLPLICFIGMGLNDTLVKYAQEEYVRGNQQAVLFTTVLFSISFISSIVVALIQKVKIVDFANVKSLGIGLFLGLVNYGSIYFLINALNSSVFDSSVVFGIINISVVACSVLLGLLIFKEKLTKLNIIGVCLTLVAIVLLSQA